MARKLKNSKISLLFLVFLALFFVLLVLKSNYILSADEGAHAMDAFFYYSLIKDFLSDPRIILSIKDYVFDFYTHYPALYVVYYSPLHGVLTSFLFPIFGINLFSVRLTSMIFSILCLITVYCLGKTLYNKKVGMYSLLIFAFTPLFFILSKMAMIEIPLLFFVLLSILFFYKAVEDDKKYFYLLGISFGIGFMVKFLIIALIPPFFIYILYRKKLIENIKPMIISSIIAIVISLPYISVLVYFGELLWGIAYGNISGFGCFFCPGQTILSHLYMYPGIIFFEIFPLIFLVPIFYFLWKRKFKTSDIFLINLIIFYFIFFTLVRTKTPKHILPVLPLFSILFSSVLNRSKKNFTIFFIAIILIQLVSSVVFHDSYMYFATFYLKDINRGLDEIGIYLNDNIHENGNVFLVGDYLHNGLVFGFARENNFKNHVIRWRDCNFQDMNDEQFEAFVEKNSIQFIVTDNEKNPRYSNIENWLEKSSFKKTKKFSLWVYENPKKDFTPIDEICEYNCKLKIDICSKIS